MTTITVERELLERVYEHLATKGRPYRAKLRAELRRALLSEQPQAGAGQESEVFAWATFDGEGGHDLRLYENNETYMDEWLACNGSKYAGWVFPLYTATPAQASAWVPEDMRELLTEMVEIHRRRGIVLIIHMEQIAEMLAAAPTPGASDEEEQ